MDPECVACSMLFTQQIQDGFCHQKSHIAIQTSTQANCRAFAIRGPTRGATIDTFKHPPKDQPVFIAFEFQNDLGDHSPLTSISGLPVLSLLFVS